MRFEIGTSVFFYTLLGRIPGVIHSAKQDTQEKRLYQIQVGDDIWEDVPEKEIEIRTISGEHRYQRDDIVEFYARDNVHKTGVIRGIDAYGTFEQDEEPSYDIMVEGENCLFKHIRESEVIGKDE